MEDAPSQPEPAITPLPSLFDFGRKMNRKSHVDEMEQLFYTCPQCGHPMAAKKCKIVCYTCHYFIGCVE